MNATLYLIPVTLGSGDFNSTIPSGVLATSRTLRKFIVEDLRSARRFLRMIDPVFPIDDCDFIVLNKHSDERDIEAMLSFLEQGYDTGLMSEAGMPSIADPGSELVIKAHSNGYRVVPLTGPSSIFLALMASGLNGQNFAFNGYLPIARNERVKMIKKLEGLSRNGQTQVFMETPYRNMKLLEDLGNSLAGDTYLCIAANISHSDEFIMTADISEWLSRGFPDINRKPAIFLIGSKG